MSMTLITTCNLQGWNAYGRNMAESYLKFWPSDTKLIVYAECFDVSIPGIIQRDMPTWFEAWKFQHRNSLAANGRDPERNRRRMPYDFRQDCVRFAHKVAAITDAIKKVDTDLLIWADADTLTHDHVDEDWIRAFLCDLDMAWLDRSRTYPECGFLIFDVKRDFISPFASILERMYASGEVFKLSETHDSYVIQQIVLSMAKRGMMQIPASLSGAHRSSDHPFVHGPLGARLDHAKGKRKLGGRTPHVEVRRSERYWSK